MKNSSFLAHISEMGQTQTIYSHLVGTSQLAGEFARVFDCEGQAALAGLAHDIGKYSQEFQRRLRGDAIKVDHSTAGAIECWSRRQPFAAFAVAGHHGGLPDGGGQMDEPPQPTFFGRTKQKAHGCLPVYEKWAEEVVLPQTEIPDFLRNASSAQGMFFTRMLYSCLVDADFLDTEAFMSGKVREKNETSVEQLWDMLKCYISDWFPPKGELNRQRCAILEKCIQSGSEQSPGLFSLTVPTGGGKTVSSLSFALAHAKKHGLRRVIYVIPYTSIIEQTAKVFQNILGAENVLEHHSNVLYDLQDEANPDTIRKAQATENWDAPVVVTTAVQFFESLYAYQPSQCRKLHNIARSVVIFDEAQMLPIPYLRPCVWAITQLVEQYGVSAVLCTATQPALEPIIHEFLPHYPVREICPPDTCQWDVFQRVTFRRMGTLTWDELSTQLNTKSQVLCVVNTRKAAKEVYERLDKTESFHLSTLMCPAHRQRQLEKIRTRLEEQLPCRVVSTSLIEAGVDVDFPSVFREIAGLDSILQAAGRCNREGKRSVAESEVTVFESELKTPPLFSIPVGAARHIMARYSDFSSQSAIHDYFSDLMNLTGTAELDRKNILSLMQTNFFPFRVIAERFHLIDSPTQIIYIPLNEGAALVEKLRHGTASPFIFRQLGRYGVSVYEDHFAALQAAGALEILENGAVILNNMDLYSEEAGLSLDADSGEAVFV